MPHRRVQKNIRLTGQANDLLERLAEYHGISQAAVVEMLIRKEGRELGLLTDP